MVNMSSSILSELDWDDGIAIPIANAENKNLEKELAQLQEQIDININDVEDIDNRIENMSRHFKNVEQEIVCNKNLFEAITSEVETENHMFVIASREEERLNQEMLRFDKIMSQIKETRNIFENKIFTQGQKIEELKAVFDWDQNALEAWIEEAARKDEDYITIKKYSDEDDSKLKQLTLLIEQLIKDSQQKRKFLDQETTDTLTNQIELDRIAEQFRETHNERQQLISLWENTIEQIKKRDFQIEETAMLLSHVKLNIMEQENVRRGKQAFLDHSLGNNRDLNRLIGKQERVAAQLRNDLHAHDETRIQIHNDFSTLQYTVTRTAAEVEVVRSNVAALKKQLTKLEDKDRKGQRLKRELKRKLDLVHRGALSAEDKARLASQVFNEEEQSVADLKNVISRTREFNFRKIEGVKKEMEQEKNLVMEIQGGRTNLKNLGSRLLKLGDHSLKQQEIIYNQEFAVQQLERRMARLQGEINANDKIELEKKILELIEVLEKKKANHAMLTAQLNRLQDDIRRMRRQMSGINDEKEEWSEKIKTLELMITLGFKERSNAIKTKQEAMVEENVLKLHVRKVQNHVHKRANSVLSLEKRALQLNTALKERKEEIAVHHAALMRLAKQYEEERVSLQMELHHRNDQIKNLQSKFEIINIPMKPPEGEEHFSQAYYVVKAAQEKEELQRVGDTLDLNIFKSQKEIKAMENTLKLLNSRNDRMRYSQKKVVETNEEFELRNQLTEELHAVTDNYKYKRRQIRELQDDLQRMSAVMDGVLRDEAKYLEMVEEKKTFVGVLEKELNEQKRKLNRAYKQYFRIAREGRELRGRYDSLVEERDIDLRNLISQNKNMAHQIAQCADGYPDMADAMRKHFTDRNLPVPSPTLSRVSSSSGSSTRSSGRRKQHASTSSSQTPSSLGKTVDLGLGLRITSSGNIPSKNSSRSSSRSSAQISVKSIPN